MIISIRCVTCNKIVGNKWKPFIAFLEEGLSEKEALDNLGLVRYCCRRMILTHVDLVPKLVKYN